MSRDRPFGFVHNWLPEGDSPGYRVLVHRVQIRAPEIRAMREANVPYARRTPRVGDIVTRLIVDGDVMMSDAPCEQLGSLPALQKARGCVLIAGLGLGMLPRALLEKPEVSRVTVIEKDADVIGLVHPHLPRRRLRVVHADAFEWLPRERERFDTIWLDIWPHVTPKNLIEIGKLRAQWSPYLAPGGWLGAWLEKQLLRQFRVVVKEKKLDLPVENLTFQHWVRMHTRGQAVEIRAE